MRIIYDLFFLIFSVVYLPYLLVKRKAHKDFLQRFSFLPDEVTGLERPVWIHAVSVGEAALAGKLSGVIKKRFPGVPVVISTTTRTGNDMARKFKPGAVDAVFYFPVDFRAVVSRVVRSIDPRLYLMVETELWPNLLEEFSSRGVPVVLVNGRISDSSFVNYKRIGFITRHILKDVERFCMQSEKDALRIKQMGAPAEKVFVTGNIKFDQTGDSPASGAFRKEDFGFGEKDEILVAGSTHSPEEETIVDVYRELRKKRSGLKLVLAPRHIERVDTVGSYIEKAGIGYQRFSDILSGKKIRPSGKDVILVDTIGHLKDIYSVATLIFVGGSLARKGGQNPIEGARWGKAVVFGPHMFNFREVAGIFTEGGGAVAVKDKNELKSVLEDLLEDTDKRENMSVNAKKIIDQNSGALEKTMDKIGKYLS